MRYNPEPHTTTPKGHSAQPEIKHPTTTETGTWSENKIWHEKDVI